MELPFHILLVYGYLLLFAWVLVEQLGVPLPATPVLLAAGALSAEGQITFTLAWAVGIAAALIADSVWFFVGRRYGHHVLRILCKLSLEPTTCVRKTRDSFGRSHGTTLVFAKFVPALATLAPPVAGQNGMSYLKFLFFDGAGAVLWVGTLLAGGRFFGDMLNRHTNLLDWAGRFSGALLVFGIGAFFVGRLLRRRMTLKELAAARLEPEELKRQLDAGEAVFIVDLRHPLELLPEPFTLPGALHFSPEALAARHLEIPRDRDVVLFCTCPSEASAAKTAMTLHKLGIERVRPLRGGYDEWKRLGFPLDAVQSPGFVRVAELTA
ncbi:MAG TPA: VTT domain-containing protein [Terracidiphilus sp.]|jgi:membrane protein DedA with SNARE-associated domain/rhodanese-related sulfurtransferase|nr:VTT domain-containing protein [Terracidiphilus sp.]